MVLVLSRAKRKRCLSRSPREWFLFTPPRKCFFKPSPEINNFEMFISGFKTIKPLSNIEIIKICKRLKIKKFKGVFLRDEINKEIFSKNDFILPIGKETVLNSLNSEQSK